MRTNGSQRSGADKDPGPRHPSTGGFCSTCDGRGWVPFIARLGMEIECPKCSRTHILLPCRCKCGALKRSPLDEEKRSVELTTKDLDRARGAYKGVRESWTSG